MNKKIALSINEMKYLESLGLDTSDASMGYYIRTNNDTIYDGCILKIKDFDYPSPYIPVYTLQDILEKLPNYIFVKDDEYNYHSTKSTYDLHIMPLDNSEKGLLLQYMNYECKCKPSEGIVADDWLEASYQMLLWCIENNYIKTNKV